MNSNVSGEGADVVPKSINEKFCHKNIDIFNLNQRHLRIDMKTKVVQQFARINISI